MPAGNKGLLPRAALAAVVCVALMALIAILSASFVAGAALACGIVLPALVFLLLSRLGERRTETTLRVAAVVVSAIIVGAVALVAVLLAFPRRSFPNVVTASVHSYNVTMRPAGDGRFTVTEEAEIELETLSVMMATQPALVSRVRTARSVAATGKGWLLREVSVSPLADVQVSLPDGVMATPLFLPDFGAKLLARLQDVAKGSVYAVKYAQGLAASPYVDTETITWGVPDLEQKITFAYIPAPWHNLRPLLAPFLTLSSFSQWLVGLLGMAGGVAFGAFVQPAVVGALSEKIGPRLPRRFKLRKPDAGNNTGSEGKDAAEG